MAMRILAIPIQSQIIDINIKKTLNKNYRDKIQANLSYYTSNPIKFLCLGNLLPAIYTVNRYDYPQIATITVNSQNGLIQEIIIHQSQEVTNSIDCSYHFNNYVLGQK
jgi:hypothetical protein